MDPARRSLVNRLGPVAEREPGGGRRQRQLARRANAGPGLDQRLQRVVIDRQRRNLRAVVILQVIPRPAGSEGRAVEVAVVAHQVAGDAFHARVGEGAYQRFERLVNVAAVQARIDGRVAAAIDDQIAFERAPRVGSGFGVKGGLDAVIGAEPVERQRHGVELGVGGRAEQLLRILLEYRLAGIQGDDLHAPHGGSVLRLPDVVRQPLPQFDQRGGGLLLLGQGAGRKQGGKTQAKDPAIGFHKSAK